MSNLTPVDNQQSCIAIAAEIVSAKQARTRRMAGETKLTSSEEMRRLLEEKRAAEETSTMFIERSRFIDDLRRAQPSCRSQCTGHAARASV